MSIECHDHDYICRQSRMLYMPLHWIPKEYLKENEEFIKTHSLIFPMVIRKRVGLLNKVRQKKITLKEAAEIEFRMRLNDSHLDFDFLRYLDVKLWTRQHYVFLCSSNYKGFSHTWEQETKEFWNRFLLKRPKSFAKLISRS